MDLSNVKLEHALASEVLARQEIAARYKELQQFVVATSQVSCPEARKDVLAKKAQEIQAEWRLEKKTTSALEEVEMHATEEWVEERGLGPSQLQMLSACEIRGDHLFIEPSDAVSPTKHAHAAARKELVIGHS